MLIRTSRRALLGGLTSAGFLAPTLRFFTRNAEANSYPLRFLFVFFTSGRHEGSVSTGTGTSFQLGTDMAPLAPVKSKLLIADGISIPDHTGEEHPSGRCALLTGRTAIELPNDWKARGVSFDRYLAGKIGGGVSFYVASSRGGMDDVPVSWHGASTPNEAFTVGTSAVMARLFPAGAMSATPMAPATPASPAGPTPQQRLDTLLYDHLMGQLRRLRGRAPQSEVEKLELHLQALTQIRSAQEPGGGVLLPGASASLPECSGAPPATGSGEAERVSRLVAHALACGRARVGILQLGEEEPYHDYSHSPHEAGPTAAVRRIDVERAGEFARLIQILDSIAEGPGTLLDNTIVMFGSECSGMYSRDNSDGNGVHGFHNMPIFFAGGKNAGLRNGERIVLSSRRTNLDVFRALAQRLGVDARDFGDPAWTTPQGVPELFRA